ncbi:homogentisate 1,2-dioxygenase [Verruconis gallopava]|uniref:homogentisate 1,2-dioxygenase n=1 Tax=Verruconis gallopava TaxID=253628 RepID=A0A0D2AEG6_9PEZI|nr:homogentisate 1,2-dioxygenase [Verruconis gallopava]KIW04855.1 homogentisate 1,2-dioxygenase [Verruconis gallopava]
MATAHCSYASEPTQDDPYVYQCGFGNRFASEAIPSVLPRGQNCPQKVKYDLYSEQLNGSGFVSPRATIQNVWMYRIRPSVAHKEISKSEMNTKLHACFSPLNPEVNYEPSQQAWEPFPLPESATRVDFIQGLKTIGGQGDATSKSGIAIHVYSANESMGRKAFCNNDGDLLILPQTGRLDVQTELGKMMVRPGELVVIQAGLRFRVSLPDGPSRGYIQEIFGAHYELPELGPVGSNGLALPRDFEMPVASFDIDHNYGWEIVYKLAGNLYSCQQNHTPFDVVAWHGNLVPYKYAIEKFINMANVEVDQADPTIYCVLTAKSHTPGISLTDFLVFTNKWITTRDTFRPPYYHRNMSTEIMGLVYGKYGGSSHVLEPGGLSYEAPYMPHGETYETWKDATTKDLVPTRICEGTLAFMFHISVPLLLTEFAMTSPERHPADVNQWDDVQGHFLEHVEEINKQLLAAGRLPLIFDNRQNVSEVNLNGHENVSVGMSNGSS